MVAIAETGQGTQTEPMMFHPCDSRNVSADNGFTITVVPVSAPKLSQYPMPQSIESHDTYREV